MSDRGRVDHELAGRDEQPDKPGPDAGQHRQAEQHGPALGSWNGARMPVLNDHAIILPTRLRESPDRAFCRGLLDRYPLIGG